MFLKQDKIMKKQLVIFLAFVLAIGMMNGASAHKSQIVGNYEIEVGWENEPPIIGKENTIIIMITHAAEDEMEHEGEAHDEMEDEMEHEGGISGLTSTLEVDVTLNGEKTALELGEDEDVPGLYTGEYTPSETGHPVVHVVGTLDDEVFEIDFHIEEVEGHIMMTPVQQQNEGITPNEVKCSEEKILLSKVSDGSAICVTPLTADRLLTRSWATYF